MPSHRLCVESSKRGQQTTSHWKSSSKGYNKSGRRSDLRLEEDTRSVVLSLIVVLEVTSDPLFIAQNSGKSSSVVSRRVTHTTNSELRQSNAHSAHRLFDDYHTEWRPTLRPTQYEYCHRRPKSASELLR